MSDINANIVVSPIDLNVVVSTNQLSFTPDAINMSIYAGGLSAVASGLDANIANVHISGGTNGYVLQTDGVGNLTWTAQTGGGGGNGSPGGSNSQVQFNNAGSFGGNSGFTFNSITGNLNVPNNIIAPNFIGNASYATNANFANYSSIANSANSVAGGNVSGQVANALVAGTVYTNAQPNITSVCTLTSLGVSGTITAANITANTGVFTGNGNGLSSIVGANVTGTVPSATTAGTVTTNAQPNITSVGTLTGLTSNGATQINGTLTVANTTTIQQAYEIVTITNTGATGTINFDLNVDAIILNTANATANFTLNFTNVSSTTNRSITCTYINTNGITAYIPTNFQINSSNVTPLWSGNTGTAGSGTASGKDMYTFNIICNSGSYVLFASRVGFV